MIKRLLFFAFLVFSNLLLAQKSYFQQQVNYKINVTLDDEKHIVKGAVEMEYTNNSPDVLNEIWIHLWGNAYKNQSSAYAKQQLNQGKLKFFRAKNENLGYFSDLSFAVGKEKATWNFDNKNPDIALIKLNTPLKSGEKISISTPFTLKIPASFSRLGHVAQSYQMTQWFPKPAVYDNRGWHAMPYLNQGEFYSEFGNFDVSITLPTNYVVGATGICQQASEYAFLERKVQATQEEMKKGFGTSTICPTSDTKTKTLRYLAENVHDFAWFADKRFWVLKEEAVLASGKKVDCWAMFTNEDSKFWTKGAEYVARSVKFYSDNVGEYPYPHATAVQSALSAGGGMEYPMITVIDKVSSDKQLDIVITHEVGHNWFYGILASNERDHGWMDEGMNTFYERRYTNLYYKPTNKTKKSVFSLDEDKASALIFDWFAAQNEDQAPETHSNDFLPINYGTCMYQKTGRSMEALENFIGTPDYDKIMKAYYDKWKFKHPYPEDFRKHWESSTNKNIAWFFDGLIDSDKKTNLSFAKTPFRNDPNYDLKFRIKSKGLNVPIPVSAIKDNNIILTKYYEMPNADTKTLDITFPRGNYDKIVIDAEKKYPQAFRQKTISSLSGHPIKGAYLPHFTLVNLLPKEGKRINIGVIPAFAYNYYDKAQLGLAFYSTIFPTSAKREITAVPLYSFTTKRLNGTANVRQSFYLQNNQKFSKIDVFGGIRSFSYDKEREYEVIDNYRRIQVGASVDFRKSKLTSPKSASLSARYVNIKNFYVQGKSVSNNIYKDTSSSYGVGELKFTSKNEYVLSPREVNVTLQAGKGFSKVFVNFNNKIQFERKKEALYVHAFAGAFIHNNNPSAYATFQSAGSTSLGPSQKDYMYDNFLIARNQQEPKYYYSPVGTKDTLIGGGLFSQQIYMQDASMRTLGTAGSSTKWMLGGGLAYNLPLPLPIGLRPYFDFSLCPDDFSSKQSPKVAYTAGIGAIIVPDIFEIYFPIPIKKDNKWDTFDKNINYNKHDKYYQRIAFMLNVNKLNPYKGLDKVKKMF